MIQKKSDVCKSTIPFFRSKTLNPPLTILTRQKWKNEIQKRLANNVSIKKYQYLGGRGEVKAYEPWAFC